MASQTLYETRRATCARARRREWLLALVVRWMFAVAAVAAVVVVFVVTSALRGCLDESHGPGGAPETEQAADGPVVGAAPVPAAFPARVFPPTGGARDAETVSAPSRAEAQDAAGTASSTTRGMSTGPVGGQKGRGAADSAAPHPLPKTRTGGPSDDGKAGPGVPPPGPAAFVPQSLSPSAPQPLAVLLDAMTLVESGGRADVVGDGGRSIGPLQIQRAYWTDARMPTGRYADCRQAGYARQTVLAYWARYAPQALAHALEGGGSGDARAAARALEILARTHNGGPRGARKAATAAYWQRVRAAMKGMES